MEKTKKTTWDTRTLVFMGLMVALHIVLTRLLVIELGFSRFTLGSVSTILAGLWLGPVAGGVCGLVSDLLGCLIKGYAVNPLITLAAILWGVVPALFKPLMGRKGKGQKLIWLCVGVVVSSVFCSLIFTTLGLVLIQGYNFYAIMPTRLVQWATMTPVYCVVTAAVYLSPVTGVVINGSMSHKTV